jgi:4-diphosphocytidyl-2-C-methyl-D-erythritol kinase
MELGLERGVELVAKAPAKVNLHLEVLGQRKDGYHEVETILQTVEIFDELRFRITKGPIRVLCEHPSIPVDRSNLCHRAAKLVKTHFGVSAGVEIELTKNIPVAAGLGGGSSDAAATIAAVSHLWGLDLGAQQQEELGSKLGADVPFFVRGGTQLGRGVGDELTPLHASGLGSYLIVTPRLEVSTARIYDQLRMGLTRISPKVNLQTIKALLSRFPERQWPGFNRLADVVFPSYPGVQRLFLQLEDTEPCLALLSGSGPSLLAVYPDATTARLAMDELELAGAASWIVGSTRRGVTLREA